MGDYVTTGHGQDAERAVQRSGGGEAQGRCAASGYVHAAAPSFTAKEAEAFRASIKEPEYVVVTPEMEAAGVERLEELASELLSDRRYVVQAVYRAMEHEQRSHPK
jgi:hypothetical protein